MLFSPVIEHLLESLRILPGVGPKSAQRMALHLLERDRIGGERLAQALHEALERVGYCQRCRNLTEHEVCSLCEDARRDTTTLCVVESPADLMAFEEAGGYRGRYFVLHGHLSPLDGIGPREIGLDRLQERFATETINEVILATNPTIEGDATASYIADMCHAHGITASRIAHGIPVGSELEMVDGMSLSHSLAGRHKIQS